MNHKRRRPANARAGCKQCKPWKANGATQDDLASRKNKSEIRVATRKETLKAVRHVMKTQAGVLKLLEKE